MKHCPKALDVMVYSRCPTCGRGFQRGRGVGSTLADTAKRAMAREMGKRMKVAPIRLQTLTEEEIDKKVLD